MSLADRYPLDTDGTDGTDGDRHRLSVLPGLGVDLAASKAAVRDVLTAAPFPVTTFPNGEGYDQLVVVRGIPFRSLCRDHLLPFAGVAHVGYLPGRRIIGLSKLARAVDHFARTLQVQRRLAGQVADWLEEQVRPHGVGVVLVAEHSCAAGAGVGTAGATTVTTALRGRVRADAGTRREFLSATGVGGL